jgi:hypothetical protein
MKLFCPLSGISYGTDIGYGHGQAPHPIFYLPLKSLIIQHLDKFCTNELKTEETHLFGCALLHKLPVQWEVPLTLTPELKSNWYKYIEKLAAICLKYDTRLEEDLPKYHIDRHSCSLSNLKYYLESFDEAIADLGDDEDAPVPSYITRNAEETILRMLRTSLSNKEKRHTFPQLMADWAVQVGNFPTTLVTIDDTGKQLPLKEYWRYIVRRVFEVESPIELLSDTITHGDLEELIEHCCHEIEVGTLHSLALLRRLREAQSIIDEFKNPVQRHTLTIEQSKQVSADFLAGEADTLIIDRPKVTIPDKEPLRKDYPNTAAYIRAKIAYNKGY